MDFGYTKEQETLRQEVETFIDNNVSQGLLDEMEGGEEGGRGPVSPWAARAAEPRPYWPPEPRNRKSFSSPA